MVNLYQRFISRRLGSANQEILPMRYVDCVPYTKIVNVPFNATTSGTVAGGFLASGGIEVEFDDGNNSNAWTPDHWEITFMPVSASLYDTKLDVSGYAFTGYGWVHPYNATGLLTLSGTAANGVHVEDTTLAGRGAYGWVGLLGVPIICDVPADANVDKVRLFNNFGGDVVAYINYTFKRAVNQTPKTITPSCGT